MDLITLDFETYYDKDFSLRKLTTEEYIRDSRFQVVGVGVKVNNGPTEWASGTHNELQEYLDGFDWESSMVLAHNTMFDGAILSWLFGIKPRVWADTLCMARALHGVEVGGSLAVLAERYNIGQKGDEILNALAKRRLDFTDEELDRYGDYCINDVELTYKLFGLMSKYFPRHELKVIDVTLRMFIHPVLDLDIGLLEQHLEAIRDRKDALLIEAGVEKSDLMSNDKFAALLRAQGVIPPTKISPTTEKETYAFAKTDEGFKKLAVHPNTNVQALAAARLGNKSTLEETRTQRFIDIAKRGLLPVPVKYYAAHTGRWGGADKINLQNLPSRGPDGKMLKKSIIAPEGYTLIDCDSSQIEARVLAWWAGQQDLIEAFNNKEDVYVKMAARIYNTPEDQVTKHQRFVGKTTILGCGYGMGADRFKDQLKNFGVEVSRDESARIIRIYRDANEDITKLWRDAGVLIHELSNKNSVMIGEPPVIEPIALLQALRLPSNLLMRYADLRPLKSEETGRIEFTYQSRRSRTRIYGGKLVENVCQAVARCVIAEQMVHIAKYYRVVMTVHDSIVCCVKDEEVKDAQEYIDSCMRWVPAWAKGMPLDCESGVAKSYGECEA